VIAVGCHGDRFVLRMWAGGPRSLTPAVGDASFASARARIARKERVDLVIPTRDGEAAAVSEHRRRLGRR